MIANSFTFNNVSNLNPTNALLIRLSRKRVKDSDGNPIPIPKEELEEAVEEKILPPEILDPDSIEDLCTL